MQRRRGVQCDAPERAKKEEVGECERYEQSRSCIEITLEKRD